MKARRTFSLDKRQAKLMGVCAGIANYLKIDPTVVRIALVAVTLLGAFPWTLIAYFVVAWAAKPPRESTNFRLSTGELRAEMRDIDRRMAEVDSFVAASDNSLSREIERLR
jgi:phage shock protein C